MNRTREVADATGELNVLVLALAYCRADELDDLLGRVVDVADQVKLAALEARD